ncbi:hypothetical protein GGR52DRAFT_579883 [Hypoxylon sp. FL1284]|nr:hypothetical protein GGR52DRAFT_579883 [Hypoxylon sp. FL1284]
MAPLKGQPQPSKAAVKRHSATVASRPVVVPALPLTAIARPNGQANKRAPALSPTNGFPASSLEAALAGHSNADGPERAKALQPTKYTDRALNGSNVEKPERTSATTAPTNGSHRIADKENNIASPANGMDGMDGMNERSGMAGPGVSSTADSNHTVEPVSASVNEASQGNLRIYAPTESEFRLLKLIGALDSAQSIPQPQSATSTTRPDLQLPFRHPMGYPLQHQPSSDQHPSPAIANGPPHMNHVQHHPHMNNGGGVVFGGFPGSHASSPAPTPTGFYPPPLPPPPPPANGENRVHPQPNGGHPGQPNGNRVPGPINTQFRPDMLPTPSIDTFGQVPAPLPPFDAFSPGVGPYGLSTPHSFPGSHTSGEPNGVENGPVNGAMPPFPASGIPYGGHAHQDHPVVPPFMSFRPFPRHPGSFDDGLREHIKYFQDQFDSGELTDCTLELYSTKMLHHPVKITGHKFIFARSPALKQHIMAARATDPGFHTIAIDLDDPYMRSDSWWSAVRHLYLHPLVDPGMMDTAVSGLNFDGDKVDRFKFCLGYAAAGHLLNMHDVFVRGLYMAADFITWATVETALGFIFEGASQRHVNYDNDRSFDLEFTYGPEVRLLLDATMVFLINEFPTNFELDASAADPPRFARIPSIVAAVLPSPNTRRTVSAPTNKPSIDEVPAVARGPNMPKPSRLSNIKFGDLPAAYPEDGGAPQRGPAKCSPILSRILLNLPFDELRAVLTSESNGVSGWNTAQDRYHAVADVVAQREARRLRAVEAIRAGMIPGYPEIQQRLSAQRRHAIVELWDVLNWQEQVIQSRGGEVPQLVRTWVPQFSAASKPKPSQQSQPQTQPQSRNVHDSMV